MGFGILSTISRSNPNRRCLMSRADIAAGNRAFEDAARTRETEKLAAFYTADAIVMPPDGGFVRGRENIGRLWASAIQHMGLKDVRLNTLDLEIVADTAYEVGEAVLSLASSNVTIKYLVVWKKVDGSWRLHRDIWNAKGA
jgi:ketosteroid isomerase-like protein